MTHRDQLRLAIEIQNGIVDKFVAARMRHMDVRKSVAWPDDMNYDAWHRFGERTNWTVQYADATAFPSPERLAELWDQFQDKLLPPIAVTVTAAEPTVTVDWSEAQIELVVSDS